MMKTYTIRQAEAEDAERLDQALAALSDYLGDAHSSTASDLLRHGFGSSPAFYALVAEDQSGALGGIAVYSPVFSTVRGAAGLYVSDLWVSESARGSGLGRRLLSAALHSMPETWTVGFLKLAVYTDNPDARAVYDKLGFTHDPREDYLSLYGDPLQALKDLT